MALENKYKITFCFVLTSAKHSQSDLKKNHETFCGLYAAAEGLSRFPALRSPRPEPRPEP